MTEYEKWTDEALRQEAEEKLAGHIQALPAAKLSSELAREELISILKEIRGQGVSKTWASIELFVWGLAVGILLGVFLVGWVRILVGFAILVIVMVVSLVVDRHQTKKER